MDYAALRRVVGAVSTLIACVSDDLFPSMRVEREGAGACDRDGRGCCQKRERELNAARVEEAGLEVNGENGDDHRAGESERGESRQQAEYNRDTAKELDERDERAKQSRHRNAHLRERPDTPPKP